jgi:hypothetical protein
MRLPSRLAVNSSMHRHLLIDGVGVTEVTIANADFDRQWLQRQRLINTPIVVAYGGYYSGDTTPAEISPDCYRGYLYEDTSGCPECQQP